MEKIKLGIIGVGNIGVTHSKNITSGQTKLVDLVAVCDIAPDRRSWAEKILHGV